MRIPSGVTDQVIYFVAVDATDLKTRETGLSSFTVYRSRDGGTATAMTTPTVTELSAANMPGVYKLLLDEDMTITAGNDSEEMCFHITQASMAPVTRTIELYRPKITAGNTLGVASDGDISGNLDGTVATVTTLTGHTAQTGDSYARLGAPAGASIAADLLAIDNFVDELESRLTAARAGYLDNLNGHSPQSGDSYTRLGAPVGASISADIAATEAHFSGMTSLTQWLGLMAGKQAGNATARTELRATGAGSGTYDETVDSLEAIRDRGDAAWTTGAGTGLTPLASGTAQAGAAGTITLAAGASATDDLFNLTSVKITGGTGAGQSRIIYDYVGSTKVASVTPNWTTNPSSDSVYEIVDGGAALALWGTTVPNALISGRVDVDIGAKTGNVALSTQEKADVNAEVDTALTDIGLDHLLAASVTGTDVTDNSIIAKLASKAATADWDTFVNTTDSLEAISDGGGGDPWNTSIPGAYGAGTAGYILGTYLTGDVYARIGAPAGASIAADLVVIDNFVDNLEERFTAARAGYIDNLNVGGNVASSAQITALNDLTAAQVNAEVDTALADFFTSSAQLVDNIWDELTSGHVTASSFGVLLTDVLADVTGIGGAAMRGTDNAALASVCTEARLAELDAANLPTDIANLNDLSAAQVNAEVDTALADIHLDHLLAVDYDPAAKPGVATALLNELVENDGGVSRYTANALEQAPSGGTDVYDIALGAAYAGTTLTVIGIPLKNNVIQTGLGTMTWKVWNNDGTQNGSNMTDAAADAQGVYKASGTYTLAANTQYYLEASITMDAVTRTIRVPITKIA